MSKAIDDLKNEHSAIRTGLSVLGNMLLLMKEGEEISERDLRDLVRFFAEFGDACHHAKEERFLFPAMGELGIEEADELVSGLLEEHDRAREYTVKMSECVSGACESVDFFDAAEDYIALLQDHIEREEKDLFPMAEKYVPRSGLVRLYERFEDHEDTVIGQGRHEELHGMLDRFQVQYLD